MVHWTVGFQLFWFTKICHELISQREILNLPPANGLERVLFEHTVNSPLKIFEADTKGQMWQRKKKPQNYTKHWNSSVHTTVSTMEKTWYFKNLCHFICLVDVQDTLAVTLSLLFGFFGLEQRFKISCFSPKTVLANFPASWLVLWCRDCS